MTRSRRVVLIIIIILGVLALAFITLSICEISSYMSSLKSTDHQYSSGTTAINMTSVRDSVRAKQIFDYFQLDTLYSEDSDTWTKALAIASFVASNIPHANQTIQPEKRNAIYLWEYTINTEPAFNCRLHSIMMFDLLQSAGIEARYITCMPEDKDDCDCHVVNHVWLPELQKWAMIDSDMGGNWASDEEGNPLSLPEIRANYISGEPIYYHPKFKRITRRPNFYYFYMAKNSFWFSCWETLRFDQEPSDGKDVGRYVYLAPSGFEPYGIKNDGIVITDAEQFWASPVNPSAE